MQPGNRQGGVGACFLRSVMQASSVQCLRYPLGSESAALGELHLIGGQMEWGTVVGHERSQGLGLEAVNFTSIHILRDRVQLCALVSLQGVNEEDKKGNWWPLSVPVTNLLSVVYPSRQGRNTVVLPYLRGYMSRPPVDA